MSTVQSSASLSSQGKAIIKLLRWDKPTGRLVLMIPALWAVFLATQGSPPALLVLVIILGSLATSAAGCVVNDLWDRDIDPHVNRTKKRPLASKALTVRVGLGVALVAFACAFGLSRYLNPLSFGLCVGAVPVIIGYPLAKRVFPVPQLVLAIAWGFAVLISWSAAVARLEPATWLLWTATVFWTLGFDTIYAMPDRPDDRRLGINSSALFFGRYAVAAIGLFFAATVAALVGLGLILQLKMAYWFTLICSSYLWIRQVLLLQHRHVPAQAYGQLFRQNVWIGFLLLGGMVAGYLL
ncbi:MAG: 4-hydroxybenzoate solanesyltransferase [Cyanobacteria bacterium P01_A01_bin.17]